jgi:DNA-binding XRE family transcriptional regulator
MKWYEASSISLTNKRFKRTLLVMLTNQTKPINPYQIVRKRLHLTQAGLAHQAKVTTQVVTNLESGLFFKPPARVTQTLIQLTQASEPNLIPTLAQYHQYQTELRYWNFHCVAPVGFGWLATIPSQLDPSEIKFEDFMRGIHPSFRGFCRLIVYQPSMLQEYIERGLNRRRLMAALGECDIFTPNELQTIMALPHGNVVTYPSVPKGA